MPLNMKIIIFALGLIGALNGQDNCQNMGDIQVFYDPSCAQGGAGCNAGGQGQLCRFCGQVKNDITIFLN